MKIAKLMLILCLVYLGLANTTAGNAFAEDKPITVTYNDEPMTFDIEPIIDSGTTLVQFRPLFEKIGLAIVWNDSNKSIIGSNDTLKISLRIGSTTATVNNTAVQLEVAPRLVDGITMVPLRFIGEATGKRVAWNAADRSIAISKGYELESRIDQFGGGSYDPDNYSGLYGRDDASIYEKDGTVYVMWSRDVSFGNTRYTNFYLSRAVDGKWWNTATLVRSVKKEQGVQNIKLIERDSVYWRDSTGVLKWTLNPSTGALTEGTYVLNQTYSTSPAVPEILKKMYRDGKEAGILFGSSGNLHIYFDDKTYPVKDLNRVLFSLSGEAKLVFNEKDKLINIVQGTSVRQLDTVSGDMMYADGKDKVTTIAPSSMSAAVFTNGSLHVLYRGNDQRMRLVAVDSDLHVSEPIITDYVPKSSAPFKLFETDQEVHMWSAVEYNRKPALSLVSIHK